MHPRSGERSVSGISLLLELETGMACKIFLILQRMMAYCPERLLQNPICPPALCLSSEDCGGESKTLG
jgi:hypothetical protein